MADLTIASASVLAGTNAVKKDGIAGEAITAGKAVYLASATKKWMLADSNSGTTEARRAGGIALNGAALNQPLAVQISGDITLGATLTAGAIYALSDTPGNVCPEADVGAGEYICVLGLAKSTTVLALAVQFPGVSR